LRSATIADVAREAGVSVATASRAISGRGPVATPTRDRVLGAAQRLEFHPSAAGRSLRLQKSRVIGFVVPDISSSFYANALKGAQHRLASAGYQVVLMDTDEQAERALAALRALARQVDGVIVCSSGEDGEELHAVLRRGRLPLIFFDNLQPGLGDGSVTLDNQAGMRMLVDHLARVHRHRRIGYVGGLLSETSGRERLDGFRLGVAAGGLALDEAWLREGDWTDDSGRTETAALLDGPRPPSAIIYADALMALGGLATIRLRGIPVPEGIAIASFDDWEAGALLDPPLTALARRDREIGDLAASLLLRVLEHDGANPMHVRIPMELVVRRSCGCDPTAQDERS
jgi:DNA-binding LacI/PurR family transcriptional regulator